MSGIRSPDLEIEGRSTSHPANTAMVSNINNKMRFNKTWSGINASQRCNMTRAAHSTNR